MRHRKTLPIWADRHDRLITIRLWAGGPGIKVKDTRRRGRLFSERAAGNGHVVGPVYVRYMPRPNPHGA